MPELCPHRTTRVSRQMSLKAVIDRGDDFLLAYPRNSKWWNTASLWNCWLTVGASKLVLFSFYKPVVHGLDRLDAALKRSKEENRGLVTVMNHMSVVDDPFLWGVLPWRYYKNIDTVRWGLAAHNVCFTNTVFGYFFSLGKILSTERFGRGPFQGSIDAAIRVMSPDDTLDLVYDGSKDVSSKWLEYKKTPTPSAFSLASKVKNDYLAPIVRSRPSWIHLFPEGFVLQLQEPFNNSMRYFKWGITRIVLESTRQPIILPIFSTGFEKIKPEGENPQEQPVSFFNRFHFGTEIKVTIGNPIDDKIVQKYREEWLNLVRKYLESDDISDLSHELKFGKQAQDLRSRFASELRKAVADIRESVGFPPEDPRFKDHAFWKKYTLTEGKSDPDVKFIGQNWAIRRLQKFLNETEQRLKEETEKFLIEKDKFLSDKEKYLTEKKDKYIGGGGGDSSSVRDKNDKKDEK